jgi:hypothetical protein
MKPHEKKKYKTRAKNKGKIKGDKKPNKKRRKDNKILSQKKAKKGYEKNLIKSNKRKEPKIKFLTHELLASTLSYLMLALW